MFEEAGSLYNMSTFFEFCHRDQTKECSLKLHKLCRDRHTM